MNKVWDKVLWGAAKKALPVEECLYKITTPLGNLISTILVEAHSSKYSMHLGETQMNRLKAVKIIGGDRWSGTLLILWLSFKKFDMLSMNIKNLLEYFRGYPFQYGSGRE